MEEKIKKLKTKLILATVEVGDTVSFEWIGLTIKGKVLKKSNNSIKVESENRGNFKLQPYKLTKVEE